MSMRARWLVIILLATASTALAQIGGQNKVRYDTFEWAVYETPHFRISHYDRVEPQLEEIASFAESSYDELARKLNFQILNPIPMVVYATHHEFEQNNIIVGFIPEGVGAFATPVRNRMVLPVDLSDRELQALIQHELTHIFQYEILFRGWRGRVLYARPPQWFMEGMASYFGDDETSRDEAYMRDAALADRVPSVAAGAGGFFAYRYGHKVFEFIEDRWGDDGVRDFVFAFQGGMGGQVGRPIQKTFRMTVEEFDAAFRSWLRKYYADFSDRGLPQEFGRRFSVKNYGGAQEVSPTVAPSGDLVAAFTTYKGEVDVAVFGVPDRRLYKNLTKGYTKKYEYLIAQFLTVGGDRGGDLAFSPDGNTVAVFGRVERGRKLMLLDSTKGGIEKIVDIPLPIDQPMSPAFSPDGRYVAFRGIAGGQSDIYMVDIDDGSIVNLTDDEPFDSAPTFTPDGEYLVFSTEFGDRSKLVRLKISDPADRDQLTFGPGSDEGVAYSKNGRDVYFASDRDDGVMDIYRWDTETQELIRITHVIGAAINPVPVITLEGERVIFQGFSRGSWDMYIADPNLGELVGTAEPIQDVVEFEKYVPAVSIPVDLEKATKVTKRRYFLEDAQAYVGVDQESNFLSRTYLSLSDQYGDRRFIFAMDSVRNYANLTAAFINMEKRIQWGGRIFDNRYYYVTVDNPASPEPTFDRERVYRSTGIAALATYPLSRFYRLEGEFGYVDRNAELPLSVGSAPGITYTEVTDSAPYVNMAMVGDTTLWKRHGPHNGNRWRLEVAYAPDLDNGGTLANRVMFEGRIYFPLSRRNTIAMRLYTAYSDGNAPIVFSYGGLDTLRGVRTRSISGNRVGFVNLEWRFPLVDELRMPFLHVGNIRGRLFLDVGTAWYNLNGVEYNYMGQPGYEFTKDGRLEDGIASYGWGITANLFGMPMNWDFSKNWDFKESYGSWQTDFWIGYRF